MSTVPSMNTIDILMARNLKDEPATKSEVKDLVKYYRWARGQSDDEPKKAAKDDLPRKDPKAVLLKTGLLKPKPQEEERRA